MYVRIHNTVPFGEYMKKKKAKIKEKEEKQHRPKDERKEVILNLLRN